MDGVRFTVRVPVDVAKFLDTMAEENFTSRNAEVIRSVRERMRRLDHGAGSAGQGVQTSSG